MFRLIKIVFVALLSVSGSLAFVARISVCTTA